MKMIHVWFSQSWLEYLSVLSATPTPRKLFFFVYKLRGHVTWATWAYRAALAWPARLLPKIKSWNTAQWKFGIVKSVAARFRWLFNVDLCKWFRLPKVQNHLPNTNSVNYLLRFRGSQLLFLLRSYAIWHFSGRALHEIFYFFNTKQY